MANVSLIKLLTSCLFLWMKRTPTTLHFLLWALATFFMLTLTEYVFLFFAMIDYFFPSWLFISSISTHYSILPTVVGWREAAGCLLHLPGDVGQVLLYTTAPQWSSSLLHGSEQVGGGGGGASGGTWQGKVTVQCFTRNYSVKVLYSFLMGLRRATCLIVKSFMECNKRDHVKWKILNW